jgi:putative endonuclease
VQILQKSEFSDLLNSPVSFWSEMQRRVYSVYMLTNKSNSVLYIGVTNNILRRIHEHKYKLVEGFTSKYNINKLVYYEFFETPEDAIKREKALKNLVRRKKEKLINEFNPNWEDLYKNLI